MNRSLLTHTALHVLAASVDNQFIAAEILDFYYSWHDIDDSFIQRLRDIFTNELVGSGFEYERAIKSIREFIQVYEQQK